VNGAGKSDAPDGESPGASILIVDDHAANLVVLEATLAPLGHRVIRAGSGKEALAAVGAHDLAVVLLDVQMPDIDGFETAARIKADPATAHVPIIFVTASEHAAERVLAGYAAGGADYVVKPFDPRVLRSKVAVFTDLYLTQRRLDAQAARLRELELRDLHHRSEARVHRLVDSMALPLCALRADGTVYDCNRAWISYAGLDAAGMARAAPSEIVHPGDLPRAAGAWLSARVHGEPLDIQCRLRRARDRAWRWHVVRVVPERDESGDVTGWIATAADIETQKNAEAEQARAAAHERRAREEAEAATRARDEFLATLSHELRTPLNAVVGWTRMLRAGMLTPEKSRKALETIERNAKAQADLIEDILDVSRIITGRLRLEIQPADLGAIAEAAIDSLRPAAAARGIHLGKRVAGGAPVRMPADPARLQQVIWNLLSNAIKFTPQGGRVDLDICRSGSCDEDDGDRDQASDHGARARQASVEIRVSDNGRGISAAFLPFVFDRFRQMDGTSRRAHGGLGLGLAIVRHLVELHGGTIRAASQGEGHGATFTVRLPIPPGADPAEAAGAAAEAASPGAAGAADAAASGAAGAPASAAAVDEIDLRGLRVLLVDDEPDARELLAEVLEQHGAAVSAAASADEALRALRLDRPDVLVSDIGLPGEDGYSLIARVRALPADDGGAIPAAALTAYARSEDSRRALAAGFHRHVVKPIQPSALAALVRDLADRRGARATAQASAASGPHAWSENAGPPVRS
jgi:PAS domain S-box-containing protein